MIKVIICLFLFIPFQLKAQENQNDTPLKLGISNVMDVMSNIQGGVRKGSAVLYNLDLTAELDTEFLGLNNGTLFLYGLVNNSKELNPIVGDLQVSSNIDNGELFRLYEFWYEQVVLNGQGSVKFGLYDLNSEFDAIEPAGFFLSSSHGIGPDFSQTGENGPSIFPSTSLSLRLQYRFNDTLLLRAVILDAVPHDPESPKSHKLSLHEGALLVGEAEVALAEGWRAVSGLWYYTKETPKLDVSIVENASNNMGVYGFVEGTLNKKTMVWLRIGIADQNINQLSHYIGAGVVYSGFLASRPNDTIGFAIAAAGNGATFKKLSAQSLSPVDNYEIAYELSYKFEVTPWLSVQPDVQYIQNPGTDPSLKDALVIGFRLEFGGEF